MTIDTIDALIFDKDGTLFDFAATWVGWTEAVLLRLAQGDRARATAIGDHIGFDLAARRFRPDSVVIANTTAEVAQTSSTSVSPGLACSRKRTAPLGLVRATWEEVARERLRALRQGVLEES